jgi:hypothetical protein
LNQPEVFDKAKWHFVGDFPDDLDDYQGYEHTRMFVGWIIDNDLLSVEFAAELKKEIRRFKARKLTGSKIYELVDGVFVDDMLNPEGLAFTQDYFDFDNGKYLADYEKLICADLTTLYHLQDTWENYDLLKPQIDKRFAAWKKKRTPKKTKKKRKP